MFLSAPFVYSRAANEAAAGRYEIRLEELRAANEQDRTRIAAEAATPVAPALIAQGTADSLRAGTRG